MIFHKNCLLADNSHEISYLIFSKTRKMSQNLSSAAVMIGALKLHSVTFDLLILEKRVFFKNTLKILKFR